MLTKTLTDFRIRRLREACKHARETFVCGALLDSMHVELHLSEVVVQLVEELENHREYVTSTLLEVASALNATRHEAPRRTCR